MAKHKRKHRLLKMLLILLCLALIAIGSGTAAMIIAENTAKAQADPQKGEAIIVLGAQVKEDGTLSRQLEWRLEAALQAYQMKARPIVVCGGQGSNEPCTEADAMTAWLIKKGVSETDILKDATSLNTFQNMKNAAALLPSNIKSVLVVTNDYHLPRALLIARDAGFEAYGQPAPILPEYWLKNHARELLAWVKYGIRKVTGWDIYLPI